MAESVKVWFLDDPGHMIWVHPYSVHEATFLDLRRFTMIISAWWLRTSIDLHGNKRHQTWKMVNSLTEADSSNGYRHRHYLVTDKDASINVCQYSTVPLLKLGPRTTNQYLERNGVSLTSCSNDQFQNLKYETLGIISLNSNQFEHLLLQLFNT